MSRISNLVIVCGSVVGLFSGCAHFVETRTITTFSKALQEQNLQDLRSSSSSEFEHKALRLAESLDDIQILKLPNGEVSIVNVEEVSPSRKRVTVEVGESKRRLLYELALDSSTEKWVVDDIYVKQRRKGLTAAKSVTEQMDLLLTVREFLSAWEDGRREEVLAVTTPGFSQSLATLPPFFMAELTRKTVGERSHKSRVKPNAQMDENIAIVRLPRTSGEMIVSFELIRDQWKVSDVAVEGRGKVDPIPSVRKLAAAMDATARFLAAYEKSDKQSLVSSTSRSFYRGTLAYADLHQFPLPTVSSLDSSPQVQIHGGHADFIVSSNDEVVKISLMQESNDDAVAPIRYSVEDVTIYELNGHQEKRLSALFTAQAMVKIFSEALNQRDLERLRQSASPDFNEKVWQNFRLDKHTLQELPLDVIEPVAPEILTTVFHGPVTEVTVRQGSRALTYVLHDHNGETLVDDLMFAIPQRPGSLKQTLEMMLPVQDFVKGLQQIQSTDAEVRVTALERLQRTSSKDFNRLVWRQTDDLPEAASSVPGFLSTALNSIEIVPNGGAMIVFGDEHRGARVGLIREGQRLVVDDVLLIAGVTDERRAELKKRLRIELANRGINKFHRVPPVQQARNPAPVVQQAGFEIPAEPEEQMDDNPFGTLEPEMGAFDEPLQ